MKILFFIISLITVSVHAMDEKPVRGGAIKSDDVIPSRFKTSYELGLLWQDGSHEKAQEKAEKKATIKAQWRLIVELLKEKKPDIKIVNRVPTPHPDTKKQKRELSYAAVVAGKKNSIPEIQEPAVEVELKKIKKKKQTRWERREKKHNSVQFLQDE